MPEGRDAPEGVADADVPARPEWEDDYLDEVAERLQYSFDLEREFALDGGVWDLYGELNLERQKYFLHPAISYGRHDSDEHLFVRRADAVSVADLEALVERGHRLADEWIEANERHYSTEFTFVLAAPEIPDDVRAFVSGFRERTLLKYGYFGHYEVNLVAVAPEREALVASEEADVADAFRTWRAPEERERGLFGRVADAIFG
ncbi:hypothetical protein GCM10009037_18260 [Halarchaeum grantii]|uniref:DUF8052 domain-containing protein n=1 Tax=Halarchaeum grantii TaxID=1193105 RepID=A0A830F3B2_9EURY|nr:hypothetical protein [Halarchaeum grantii]GGL34979.1 hypothetical protein GCM10009037_18260 [Halarchaeum grantii]